MEILNRHRLERWPPRAIYVGRGHPLGNPYQIGPDGTREEVIAKYRHWIETCLRTGDGRIIDAFRYLREDSILVCSCVPKPCHAEVIREIWERHFRHQRPLVWVFGTDAKGRHLTPSARFAKAICGACPSQSEGLQQAAYAIPVLDERQYPLPLSRIAVSVRRFLESVKEQPEVDFKCGDLDSESNYPVHHLAPLFACVPSDCQVPEHWQEALKPYQGLNRFPVRLAVIGSGRLDRDWVWQRFDYLTSQLELSKVALLCRKGDYLGELAQHWAKTRGIAYFTFPAYWREIRIPHAQIRHGSVGKRYNERAGEDSDVRILVNATHATLFEASEKLLDLTKTLQLKARKVRLDY